MRKLSDSHRHAVTGLAWWQIPQTTGRQLSAQTGQSTSGSSPLSGLFKSNSSRDASGAYKQSAQRLMKMATDQAQKGNVAEARRYALTAARYQVTWGPNETSPQQLLRQLGGSPSTGLNPAAVASRQLQPTRPSQAPSGLRPTQQPATSGNGFAATGGNAATGFQNIPSNSAGAQSGSIQQVGGQSFASRRPVAASGNVDPIRRRVDDYMQRAWDAWQAGDRDEAIRLASVADLLGESVTWRPGEPTPTQFIARVRSGRIDPEQPIALNPPQPAQPVAPTQPPVSDPFAQPGPQVTQQVSNEQPADAAQPIINPVASNQLPPQPVIESPLQAAPVIETPLVESPLPTTPLVDSRPVIEKPLTAILPDVIPQPREEVIPQPAAISQPLETVTAAAPERNVFSPAPVDPQALADAKERKQYAGSLLMAAREDIRSNRLEDAYEKALMASEFDVAWTLFEETPDQLVAEIQRRQKQSVPKPLPLVATPPAVEEQIPMPEVAPLPMVTPVADPFQPPQPFSPQTGLAAQPTQPQAAPAQQPLTEREYALQLVAEARQLMREGRYDEARAAALKAQSEEVSYGLFDDRPELVLRQLDRLSGTVTLSEAAAQPAAAPAMPQPGPQTVAKAAAEQKHAQAQQLLAAARSAADSGDLTTAKSFVAEAQQLGVTYRLFDETPEVVLADIARLESGATMPDSVPEIADPSVRTLPNNPFPVASATQNAASSLPTTGVPSAEAAQAKLAKEQRAAQAAQLLGEARQLIKQGNLDAARQKAQEASKLDVIYDLFADQPRDVLLEIARIQSANTGSNTVAKIDAAPALPAAPAESAPASDVRREQAQVLLELAREEVAAGRLDQAELFAQKVRDMNLTFGPYELQPNTILAEIAEAKVGQALPAPTQFAGRQPEPVAAPPAELPASITIGDLGGSFEPQDLTPAGDLTPAVGSFTGDSPFDNITAIHPSGVSAETKFNEGQNYLRRGNREAAYQAFLEAWQSGQRLDAYKSQQLQDYLRELNPRRGSQIQLTSGEIVQADAYDEASPIDVASQRDKIRFDRLRSEVLNAMLRADSLKERRPDEAIEVLDQAMANVENAGFENQQVASLVRQLQRSRGSIEGFMAQRAPILDLERRNQEVKEDIARTRNDKIRVEQEFAALVDDYNRLFKQRRFAEAQVIAKQAEEIDPTNPVAVNMKLKAKFAARNDSNEQLRENKDNALWKTLNDVEEGFVFDVGNDKTVSFPENWKELTERRRGRYGNDNRED